ncbi:hypothetical protein QYF36_022414 [Acer negundo]|nr:hypothetical protein QYF36_022414 [Acer negundo]
MQEIMSHKDEDKDKDKDEDKDSDPKPKFDLVGSLSGVLRNPVEFGNLARTYALLIQRSNGYAAVNHG